MSQDLPFSNFTFLTEEECRAAEQACTENTETRDAFFQIDPATSKWYYILTVDLL